MPFLRFRDDGSLVIMHHLLLTRYINILSERYQAILMQNVLPNVQVTVRTIQIDRYTLARSRAMIIYIIALVPPAELFAPNCPALRSLR